MSIKTKTVLKKRIVNFFGSLAYLTCLMSWFMVIMAYFSSIQTFTKSIIPDKEPVSQPIIVVSQGVNLPMLLFAIFITILMIALTVYVMVKLPSVVAKTSKKIIHDAAEQVAPIVIKAQHKEVTKSRKIKSMFHIIVVLKVILIAAPLILVYSSASVSDKIISIEIVTYVSLWLAGLSAILFATQYFLASLLSVKRQDIW